MEENTIPNAYEEATLDRGDLIVNSRQKKKKTTVIIAFVLLAVVVLAIAVIIAVNQFRDTEIETQSPITTSSNTRAVSGVETGTVSNDSAWFAEVKRKREKEKQAEEKANQRELERERQQSHQQTAPVVVTKSGVSDTPKPTVTPTASKNSRSQNKNVPPTPAERRLMGGVMIEQQSSSSHSQNPAARASYDDSYNAPTFAMGSAVKRQMGMLDFLLKHGTVIPCALYSQVISDYQGIVMCRVTQDIYSANGKALLVERGSLLTGSQNIQLEAGKNRLFTTWGDIETPNGISIRIDSLGAGRLGASGNEAWIDNHFKERFGGAILLSFLDDAFEALASKVSSSNGDITFDNSTETAGSIAEKALESSINIAPTGYTQIGQRINIIVARDIDMSAVYTFQ